MPPASERGREVRRRLLAAAVELIAELGWNAVSTRVLADRAGVAPGLVHYHFASLQALLSEAAVTTMREIVGGVKTVLERADSPEAGLDALVASLDTYSGSDPTSLLFIEAYLAATRDERLRADLADLVEEFRAELARFLERHGRDTPEETASVVAAAIDGALLHRALRPELTSSVVAPVLRRTLTPSRAEHGG